MKYFVITLILIIPLYILVGYLFVTKNSSVVLPTEQQKPTMCTKDEINNIKISAVYFQSSHLPISDKVLNSPCLPIALKNAYLGYQNSKGQSDKIANYLKEYDNTLVDFLNTN